MATQSLMLIGKPWRGPRWLVWSNCFAHSWLKKAVKILQGTLTTNRSVGSETLLSQDTSTQVVNLEQQDSESNDPTEIIIIIIFSCF